jgi:hypothetical protein
VTTDGASADDRRSRPREAAYGPQSLLVAGPVTGDGLRPGPADDPAQHERDEDRVVGVTEDRDEVGDQVDRHRQVGEQQPRTQAHPTGQRWVAREPRDEAEQIRKQPDGVPESAAFGPGQRQEQDEDQPQQEQTGRRRGDVGEDPRQEPDAEESGASSTMSSNSPSFTPRMNASHSAGV